MMRIFLILSIVYLSINFVWANDLSRELNDFISKRWELSSETKKDVLEGKILVEVDVTSKDKKQKFALQALGIHPKSCTRVLRKLSRFEEFSDWISFIKKSTYHEKQRLITIHADHLLLPFPMLVHIIIDRPTKPGVYPFIFPTGIFTGLTGKVVIEQRAGQCFFYSDSNWQGKDTGINDMVIDVFATTLSKIGAEMLMRKTQF